MKWKSVFLWVVLALALSWLRIPVASSQAPVLTALKVQDALPVKDLDNAVWSKASPLVVPLSAQAVARPVLPETKIKSVTARALYNDQDLALLVEWADPTLNIDTLRPEDFRDAVAIQFPLVDPAPYICMGQPGTNVNLWHWKADWQADLAGWRDMQTVFPNMNVDQYPFAKGEYPLPSDYTDANYVTAMAVGNLFAMPRTSPVENLIAGGFSSVTAQPPDKQVVQGHGEWANGTWRVIFTRALRAADAENINLQGGKSYPIAFAAWDGANGERNGQKSASQWMTLELESEAGAAARKAADLPSTSVIPMFVVVALGTLGMLVLLRSAFNRTDSQG